MKKNLCVVPLVLLFCLTMACQDKAAMAELKKYRAQAKVEDENSALFRKVADEWNKRNIEFFMNLHSPDYVYFTPSGTSKPMSHEGVIEMTKMIWAANPDAVWRIDELIAKGDMVMSRNTFTGTNKEAYMGIPPTGDKIEFSSMIMCRIKNGKIIEEREEMDGLSMMQQLGMELKPIQETKK